MFREKIRGAINEKGLNIKKIGLDTKINCSSLSSFLAGSRQLNYEKLEILIEYLGLTLVPKQNFKYQEKQ